jgi:hypothetical protein
MSIVSFWDEAVCVFGSVDQRLVPARVAAPGRRCWLRRQLRDITAGPFLAGLGDAVSVALKLKVRRDF